MQEIAPKVYIETNMAGVTLGAIDWEHGLVLIDTPFRNEDLRAWRSALVNMGGGVDRLLVNLDSHMDRTMGIRAMDCTVIGHEKMVQAFRNRPAAFKSQNSETGAEWELYDNVTSARWVTPESVLQSQCRSIRTPSRSSWNTNQVRHLIRFGSSCQSSRLFS